MSKSCTSKLEWWTWNLGPAVGDWLVSRRPNNEQLGWDVLTLKEEESVVVNLLHPAVQVEERGDVLAAPRGVDDVARLEVEPRGVELERLRKVGHAAAKVTELVHRRGRLLEALRLVDGAVLVGGEVVLELGQAGPALNQLLAVDEVEGEVVDGVAEGDALAAAGGVEVLDGRCLGQRPRGQLQVRQRLDHEGGAAELVGRALARAVDERVHAVALVEDGVAPVLGHGHAEVGEELPRHVEVGMAVVDVCDAHELDLGGLL